MPRKRCLLWNLTRTIRLVAWLPHRLVRCSLVTGDACLPSLALCSCAGPHGRADISGPKSHAESANADMNTTLVLWKDLTRRVAVVCLVQMTAVLSPWTHGQSHQTAEEHLYRAQRWFEEGNMRQAALALQRVVEANSRQEKPGAKFPSRSQSHPKDRAGRGRSHGMLRHRSGSRARRAYPRAFNGRRARRDRP